MPFSDKEKRKEYEHQWRIEKKEKRQLQNKIWREKNEEKIKEYSKNYRLKNNEHILDKNREKITCDCGSVISRSSKSDHLRNEKHTQYLIDNIKISNIEQEALSRAKYAALRESEICSIISSK